MESFLILIPLLLVLVTLLYSVLYAILRAWLDYRVRITLLDKVDHNPQLLETSQDLERLVTEQRTDNTKVRQNYALTGLMIAAIGIGCIVFGRMLRVGDVAVGTYLGGMLCFLLGAVLAALGGLVRILSRDPTQQLNKK